MKKLWATEPVLIVGFFQSAIALAVTFGAKLTVDQVGAIIATLSALLAIFVRSQVTPQGNLNAAKPASEPKPTDPP